MSQQLSLLNPPKPLSRSQGEVYEALRVVMGAADTTDIQRALAEHWVDRAKNEIASRLVELERKGLVERVGRNYVGRGVTRTTWRRT